ncbi:hypothetical protein, partial [Stutzerimonas stutzeri]|uniref:hypothetical protein n=1 Tax=Stutzerimonas stutzeri TaxID=316 RepID=UPI0012FDFE0A
CACPPAPHGGAKAHRLKAGGFNLSMENKDKDRWEWDVGSKGKKLKGESIFYAFVNLKGTPSDIQKSHPEVFIVPSAEVASYLDRPMSRYMFWIKDKDKDRYLEAWHLITDRLLGPAPADRTNEAKPIDEGL